MPSSNPLLWPKAHMIWGYGIAVLSVTTALIIARLPAFHLEAAPVSLFLCAIMFTAWFGGVGPGLIATWVSALIVGLLSAAQRSATESLRRARDDLRGTVQELQRSHEALQAESLERKHAEETLRQAQADLAHVNRVTTMGELTASLAHEVNHPIAAAVTNANTCLRWNAGGIANLEEARAAAMRIV